MKTITNTATTTYQYTIGNHIVTKSTATCTSVVINVHRLRLHLATLVACVKSCQPYWYVLAVENPSNKAMCVFVKCDLSQNVIVPNTIAIGDGFIYGDIRQGIRLMLAPCQCMQVRFGAQAPYNQGLFWCNHDIVARANAWYCFSDGCEKNFTETSNCVCVKIC